MKTERKPQAVTPESRCTDCRWVDEADSEAGTSFKGVALCPLHGAAPRLLSALKSLAAWHDHPALTGLPDGYPVADWAPSFDETVSMTHAAIAKAEARP